MLTDEQKWQYHQQGYLKLGRTLSDAELSALQERINAIMMGTAQLPYDRMLMQLDGSTGNYAELGEQSNGFKGPTLNYRKIQDLELDPLFLAYMQKPLFEEICAWQYGAHASISCFRAMFMNKPAGKGTLLPWHQDGGLGWSLDRDPLVTVWTGLDKATKANGCVKVIPGSHRLGLLSAGGHVISPEQEARHCVPGSEVYLELEAGEAVLLHNWILHGSDVNPTGGARRAFSVCYMDARTRSLDGKAYPVVMGVGT